MVQSLRQSNLYAAEDWKIIYRAFSEVNFNAFDFDTIKRALFDYVRLNFPEDFDDWVNSSEFVALIDLVAHMGEALAFRMDLDSRDNFIDVAERRNSVLRLANLVSFQPRRNIAGSGLVKLVSVQTNDDVFDSNGVNLADTPIEFDDQDNPDWFEQWITVLNNSLVKSNPYGEPIQRVVNNNVTTDLYRFDNLDTPLGGYSFNVSADGLNLPFQIINADLNPTTNQIEERDPIPGASYHIIFRNDKNGFSSPNTGFFFSIKQGTLGFQDYDFSAPLENRLVEVDVPNINNSDVWVQSIEAGGEPRIFWDKIPALAGNNVIFNSVQRNERNLFSVLSRVNDQISIRFGDGRFANIPTGLTRIYYRTSANEIVTVRPRDIVNQSITIPYLNRRGIERELILTFRLEEQIANSSRTQNLESIRRDAPAIFYTNNRLVNGEDYNVGPLSSPLIIKSKAINRKFAGHSRFIDDNDPTGQIQNTNVFADDGILYLNEDFNREEVDANLLSSKEIVVNYIEPAIKSIDLQNFFYNDYKNQFDSEFPNLNIEPFGYVWEQSVNSAFSSSGKLIGNDGPISVGKTPTNEAKDTISEGALLKFKNAGWANVHAIIGAGNRDLPSGQGPIVLNEGVSSGDILEDIIPSFRTTLTEQEINQIAERIDLGITFAIQYDFRNRRWSVMNLPNNGFNDGSWNLFNPSTGWLIKLEKNNISSSNSWEITYRGLEYVFESIQDVRFWFNNTTRLADSDTGRTVQDTINILPINPVPGSDDTECIGIGKGNVLTTTGQFYLEDGTLLPQKIKTTFIDMDNDGTPENPNTFRNVVQNDKDGQTIPFSKQLVFWEKIASYDGFINEVPINIRVFDTVAEMDQNFIDSPQSWTDDELVHVSNENVYYIFSEQNIDNDEDSPRFGLPLLPSEQDKIDSEDPRYENYIRRIGRRNLNFQWKHYAPQENRIDPSITNVIDIFVLTEQYNRELRRWIVNDGPEDEKPEPPSPQELRNSLQNFENTKMISDEIIWKPVKFRLLFGSKAREELRAKFRVVKIPTTEFSDGEIRSIMVNIIDNYFSIFNWDFGEKFFATDLLSYIHIQLSTAIASVTLVPQNEEARFGNLFEIDAEPDEIFISAATIDDIEIVTSLTETTLRVNR